MKIRHDLSERAVVGYVRREGDDAGPVIALTISDKAADVHIGIRIHTVAQAEALLAAAREALDALEDELATSGPQPVFAPACLKCGGRLFHPEIGVQECALCGTAYPEAA